MSQQFRVRDKRTERRYFVDNVIVRGYGWIIGPIGIAVYNGLCVHADKDTQDCRPSHQTIADLIGASKAAVKRHLKLLQSLGLVSWHPRMYGNERTSNEYVLLDPPDPPVVDEFEYPEYMNKKPAKRPVRKKVGSDVPHLGSEVPQVGSEGASNNPHVTIPKDQIKAAGAALYQGYAHVVTRTDEEDSHFNCPACDELQPWPRKKRTNFRCQVCGVPLAGFEHGSDLRGDPLYKPPRKQVPDTEKYILGNLIPNCPEHLKGFPYLEKEGKEIVRLLGLDRALLLQEIDYQCQRYLGKKGRRDQVVHNGMVSAGHKIGARKESDATQTSRDPPAPAAVASGIPIWGRRAPPQSSEAS